MPSEGEIKIENISISLEGKDLFVNASLLIANGKRYGLVGSKNCGKTMLLEQIAKREFGIPSTLDVLYWTPEIEDDKLRVDDFVLAPSEKYAALLAEREQLKAEQEEDKNCDKRVEERLAEIWEELILKDPKIIPAKATAGNILSGLGFSIENQLKTISQVPKHLRRKVTLARALFLEPTLLILDEPTVELDIDAIIWLVNYLQDWKKTLIVVSQDRCFLDNVCNGIIYVDQQKLFQCEGNYSSFELFVQNEESSKAKVKTQNGAMSRSQSQNETEIHSEDGRVPVKQLQKLEFSFSDPVDFERRELVQLVGVTFGYKRSRPILRKVFHTFNYNPKNAVVGSSGVGKSTLLRLASGTKKPMKGEVKMHPEKISVGIFDQNSIDRLPADQSPLEYVMETCKSKYEEAEKQLSKLGLASHSHTGKIKDLSAGEKARVVLAKFCLLAHDALFLDEPTRYLDIEMIDALADAIGRFKGGVIMVTNNESLIRETECELSVVEKQEVNSVEYYFDDYRKYVLTNLDEPIRGPFIYKRKTPLRSDAWPLKLRSNSKIIENYIRDTGADPNIREIGKYFVFYDEGTHQWNSYSPTLTGCYSFGKTREICEKRMREMIEYHIEDLIENGSIVPPPP